MRKLNEIGIGSFRPGREPQGSHIRSVDLMGPASNADSVISQRMQYNVGSYNYDDEEFDEDDNDLVLECRVYRDGKYCLIETLALLSEFNYADDINSMMAKLNRQKEKRDNNIDNMPSAEEYVKSAMEEENDIDEEPLEEFSGAAAAGGGPAVPLGYTAKGKPETPAQRRKRQRFNITKSYPYNKLANPPKKRRKK